MPARLSSGTPRPTPACRQAADAEERDRPVATHTVRWEADLERGVAWFLRLLDALRPCPPTLRPDGLGDNRRRRDRPRGMTGKEPSYMTQPTTTPPANGRIPDWVVRPDRGTQPSPPPPPWGAGLPTPGEGRPVPQWARATWIIWCAFWALFWITAGWLVLPFVNVVLAGASVALVYAVEPNRPWSRTPTVIVVNNPPPPAQ